MSKKHAAVEFLKMASAGEVDDAYARYIAPEFVHHNQYFKGDRESLKRAMAEAHRASPNKMIDVKRVLEDGDFVVTISRVVRGDPEAPEIGVVHVFRFDGDKAVELWDFGQLLDRNSPNENGPF